MMDSRASSVGSEMCKADFKINYDDTEDVSLFVYCTKWEEDGKKNVCVETEKLETAECASAWQLCMIELALSIFTVGHVTHTYC